MTIRLSPSGPVAEVGDLPAGVNGQVLATVGAAAQYQPGYITARYLPDLQALPLFDGAFVVLRGLAALNDDAGGLFYVLPAGTLIADGFDVIDLAGANSDRQIQRVSEQSWNVTWANSESTATPLLLNTPTFCGTDHVGFGQGPWSKAGPEQLQWDGRNSLIRYGMQLIISGTAGDEIWAEMSPVTAGPIVSGAFRTTLDAGGNGAITGSATFFYTAGDQWQLSFENRTGANAVTLVTSLIDFWKLKGNQDTLYL